MLLPGVVGASLEYDRRVPQLVFAGEKLEGAMREAGHRQAVTDSDGRYSLADVWRPRDSAALYCSASDHQAVLLQRLGLYLSSYCSVAEIKMNSLFCVLSAKLQNQDSSALPKGQYRSADSIVTSKWLNRTVLRMDTETVCFEAPNLGTFSGT